MKYAIVIPDGCADEPQESLGGKTPLQAANTPNMDRIARTGVVGRSDNVPRPLTPASEMRFRPTFRSILSDFRVHPASASNLIQSTKSSFRSSGLTITHPANRFVTKSWSSAVKAAGRKTN